MLEHLARKIVAVVELREILDELGARHFPADVLAVEIRVEEHDGTRQRVHGVLGVEGAGIAVEVPLGEVYENALALLGLAGQRELREELPQSHVQRVLVEAEVPQVFLGYCSAEIVAGTRGERTRCKFA